MKGLTSSGAATLLPVTLIARRAAKAEAAQDWKGAEELWRLAAVRRFADPAFALRLASTLDRQGEHERAQAWVLAVIDSTLKPHYNARAAFNAVSKYFAERHEIAEFIVANREPLQRTISSSRKHNGQMTGKPHVFTYWDDTSRMPAIVRAAQENRHRHIGDDWELVELDAHSIADWVELDEKVVTNIGDRPAQFSDYLRLKLLQRYGGLWLDATAYLTEDLSDGTASIRDHDAFLFRYGISRVGSWFFWAKPDSYVLNAVTAVYELWWRTEGRLTNYFLLHDIIEMLYWTDPAYKDAWDQMKRVHPRRALAMRKELARKYNETSFNTIAAGSFIHKLSYKFPAKALNRDTFARHIIQGDLSTEGDASSH